MEERLEVVKLVKRHIDPKVLWKGLGGGGTKACA
jgi:hypothetical protein